jgi:hypothetical protein
VPWGVSGFELQLMLHTAHGAVTALDLLSAATARAGEHLGLAPLGHLVADMIAVSGDATARFKALEYPDLVISGGVIVVDPTHRTGEGYSERGAPHRSSHARSAAKHEGRISRGQAL